MKGLFHCPATRDPVTPSAGTSRTGVQARWLPFGLLLLAGIGPIVLNQFWPALNRQDPLVVHNATALELPIISFENGQGKSVSIADFKGRVVLLNVWATWCAPCREEMPALDRLQAKLGGAKFEVVALSVDRVGMRVIDEFFKANAIRNLKRYIGDSDTTMQKLRIVGLPTTLLIDRKGREIRRYVGAAEWDRNNFAQVIRNAMEQQEQWPRDDDIVAALVAPFVQGGGYGSAWPRWRS